ncbi:hypothetical protein [Actinoplanes sp. NPDC048796]|uniref:hypothetical protein n=1 Tax=Actinoplanes sp. NPDC048796 TaxID=3155640 RepID=UPI0033C03C51
MDRRPSRYAYSDVRDLADEHVEPGEPELVAPTYRRPIAKPYVSKPAAGPPG